MVNKHLRHALVAAIVAGTPAALSTAATAQTLSSPVTSVLAKASDNALDKLAQPGAFYADEAVRILLPGPLRKASKLMKIADQTGLTNGLTKSLNDAAGIAAKEAKPIFRKAINGITLQDGIGILTKGDGATQYLRESAGTELLAKIRPLVAVALGKTGAYGKLEKLGRKSPLMSTLGLSRESLTDSVADQAMAGIFSYIGNEEASLRADPLSAGKAILKGLN